MEKKNGWVVVASDGYICTWTWAPLRKKAQSKFLEVWHMESWKHHYRKGYRCVRATRTIELQKPQAR